MASDAKSKAIQNIETESVEQQKNAWGSLNRATLLLPLAVFGIVLVRTAWLSDDAYITFRTVENFVTGFGLTWNPAERVQAYTHPLWMFLMSFAYYFTREMFLTPIAVSIAVSAGAMALLLMGLSRTAAMGWIAAAALISSRAFVDYSTSGLENPLTHFCLILFLIVYFSMKWSPRILGLLCLITALGMLNRLDTALFYGPALLYVLWDQRSVRAILWAALGGLPIVLWEIFSVLYYGFPFPNTAYAKLGTGISDSAMFQQGLQFFAYTWNHDALTLAVIAAGIVLTILRRDIKGIAIALGLVLYLVYIAKIGGDFMGGRFFTAPLFVAAALLTLWRVPDKLHWWTPVIVLVIAAGFYHPYPTLKSDDTFGNSTAGFKDPSGIGDERRFYYKTAGLLQYARGKEMPTHEFAQTGRQYRNSNQAMVKKHGSVGYRGFFGGPKVHIVDYYSLTDPLLARLPAIYNPNWRIGHFSREVPEGYLNAAFKGDASLLQDKGLGEYYAHLLVITRGPIWSLERWKQIWKMNTGQYDELVDGDKYRFPGLQKVQLAQLSKVQQDGNPWNAPGAQVIGIRGVEVELGGEKKNAQLELSLDSNDQYKLLFMHEGDVLAELDAPAPKQKINGLATQTIGVPKEAATKGYTAIRIMPSGGDKRYSIGHLALK